MKRIVLSVAILSTALAQAQRGIGTDTPDKSSVLELTSTKRGLLIPRVNLTATNNPSPVDNPANSLLVYNKATAGTGNTAVSPGYYFWNATENKWVRMIDSNSQNVYTAGKGMLLTGNEFSRTGLEEVTENGKTGWRLIGKNPNFFGNIGENAVDFSTSNSNSNTFGATGLYSFTSGFETTASGNISFASGYGTTASGESSFTTGHRTEASGDSSSALGSITIASGISSLAAGHETIASGNISFAMGEGLNATNKAESVLGAYNTSNSKVSKTDIGIGNYRLFSIGNGLTNSYRSDAFTVLTNGKVGIDIDNFEKNNSDAKLQVNGKTLIGNFGDNNTNNNTIHTVGNAKAQLDVRGDVAISTITEDNSATYMLVEGANGIVKKKEISSTRLKSKSYNLTSGTYYIENLSEYDNSLVNVIINAIVNPNDVIIVLPQPTEANLGQTIAIKIKNTAEITGAEQVTIMNHNNVIISYGQLLYQSWLFKSDGTIWEQI